MVESRLQKKLRILKQRSITPNLQHVEDVIALDIYQLSDEVFGWERCSSAPEVAGFVERTGG
jgi:hypothetical protein